MSLAEKFIKRRFRSNLPTLDPFFNPVQINEEGRKRFKIGDQVRIQNAVSKRWDDFGTVREIRDSGRSYYIDRGRDTVLRNNIFFKLIAPPFALREHAVEESHISSGSYRAGEEEETRLYSDFLLLTRPAVAVPAAREPKRESTRVRKQTVRFSP
jgi:hypothetical protein